MAHAVERPFQVVISVNKLPMFLQLMAVCLPVGDIIVCHEYFDVVIRSKCAEFLNSSTEAHQ